MKMRSFQSALSQVKSCSAVMVLGLTQGMALGWTSPALAKLRSGEGPFKPSLQEATWIASVFDLGLLLGVGVSAAVFSRMGRRQTLLVAPVSFLAWVLLTYLADSSWLLCIARLLAGAGQGVAMWFSYIYIAEVTTPRLRSALVLSVTLLLPLGQLVAYTLGPYVSYAVQSVSPLPLLGVCLLLVGFCMQESPFYLAAAGEVEDVVRVLTALRVGVDADEVRAEADSILRSVKQQVQDARSWREVFSAPGARRAAAIVLVESGSLAVLGVTTVLAFTQQIFQEAGTSVPPELCAMVLIALKVSMVMVAMALIERLGRRLQLCLAAVLNAVAMAVLASYFLARDQLGYDVTSYTWVPIASLCVFISASGVGVNSVPQVLMGELLSQRAKAIVAPLAIAIVSATSFALNKSFLLLGASVGFGLPFGLHALANLLLALFTFLVVPETKGRTLMQVQEMLSNRSKREESLAGTRIAPGTFSFKERDTKVVDAV